MSSPSKEPDRVRPGQRLRYADRVDRTIRHLVAELEQERVPGVSELAAVAAMSEHHFQRVYRLMTGETIGSTIRRLRLARSLPGLMSDSSVTEASGASAYATSQAFARALRAQVGTSASDARAEGVLPQVAAHLARSHPPFAAPLSVEVITLEPFTVVAIRNVGDYAELDRCYGRLFEVVLDQHAPDSILGIYGIPHDDPRFEEPQACRFDCALKVDDFRDSADGLEIIALGGRRHLSTRHVGSFDRLPETMDDLYLVAIEEGLELADFPCFIHYLDEPESRPEADLRSDVFLPLLS